MYKFSPTHCYIRLPFLKVLGDSNASHFFVLFRDGLKFRGLYTYSQDNDEVSAFKLLYKIHFNISFRKPIANANYDDQFKTASF